MKYLSALNCEGVYFGHLCKKNKLKTAVGTFVFLIMAIALISSVTGKLFYQNLSPSAPFGLYVVAPDQRIEYGDYVIVSLPVDVPALNVKKGFSLLKKVQGFPGDSYNVDSNGTSIRGRHYRSFSRPGLPVVAPGTYTVPDDSMLFLNDPEDSFDSRYLGPVKKNQIVKKVILLVPYEPFL